MLVKTVCNGAACAVCLAVIDSDGRVTVKASTKVANKASSFAALLKWVANHCKQNLPVRYVMEATARAAPRSLS